MEVSSSSPRSLNPLYLQPQPAPYRPHPALLAPTVPLIQKRGRSRSNMDPPFSEDEKRYLLAEALKTTRVPLEKILALINENGGKPAWSEMPLPFGRSMNSSIATWDALQQEFGTNNSLALNSTASQKRKSSLEVFDAPTGAPEAKRRQSSGDATPLQARSIQPGPRPLAGSPRSFSPLGSGQQQKKRGRPSKADIEARNAAAIARGEVLPPLRPAVPRPRKELKESGPSLAARGLEIMGQPQVSPRPLAPNQPTHEHSFIGPGGATIAAMTVASHPTEPSKVDNGRVEGEANTQGKRKPPQLIPKSMEDAKTGDESFHSVHPHFSQFHMTAPPSQYPPITSTTSQKEAEIGPSQLAHTPRVIEKETQDAPKEDQARSDI